MGREGRPEEFVAAATRAFEAGNRMLPTGGTNVEINGDRAIAKSKLRIMQRGLIHDVTCDVTCIGINFDFIERRNGRWGFVLRQPVYERDYVTTVEPGDSVTFDSEVLARRPDGYRRLAYLQEGLGFTIRPDLPTEGGPEREALFRAGDEWLSGAPLGWPVVVS